MSDFNLSVETLFVFDFDGTLCPIVPNRNDATASPQTLEQLTLLSEKADVAVVSGRSLADLRQRLPQNYLTLVGNHGIEGPQTFSRKLSFFHQLCRGWVKQLQVLKTSEFDLEDKGYSLTLHCTESSISKVLIFCEGLTPSPKAVRGKSCINLTPREAPHKGDAVMELFRISKAKNLVYVGDDSTDEDVFALTQPKFITIRIGPLEHSKAKFYLQHQQEINELLFMFIQEVSSTDRSESCDFKLSPSRLASSFH